jgi:hypothetical protein
MQLQQEGYGNEFVALAAGYFQTLWFAQYGGTDSDRNDLGDDGVAAAAFSAGYLVYV